MDGGRRSEEDDADALARGDPEDPGTLPSTFIVSDGEEEEEEEEEEEGEEEEEVVVELEEEDEDETRPSRRAATAKASHRQRRGRRLRGDRGGSGGRGHASAGPAAEVAAAASASDYDSDSSGIVLDGPILVGDDDDVAAGAGDGPHFSTQPLMFGGATAQPALPPVHDEHVWKLLVEALSMGALEPAWTRHRYMAQRAHVAGALANVDDRIHSSLAALRAASWTPAIANALRTRPRAAITLPPSVVGYVACDLCRKWNHARCVVRLSGRHYESSTYWPTPEIGRAHV